GGGAGGRRLALLPFAPGFEGPPEASGDRPRGELGARAPAAGIGGVGRRSPRSPRRRNPATGWPPVPHLFGDLRKRARKGTLASVGKNLDAPAVGVQSDPHHGGHRPM